MRASRSFCGSRCSMSRAVRARAWDCEFAQGQRKKLSKRPTSWWRLAARPTPTGSTLPRPASSKIRAAISASTHVGEDDCRVVLDNLAGGKRTTRGRLIPYCLFTDPELAHVGLTESETRSKGISYRIARMPMAMVLRTHTLSEKRGFIKALIGSDDRLR